MSSIHPSSTIMALFHYSVISGYNLIQFSQNHSDAPKRNGRQNDVVVFIFRHHPLSSGRSNREGFKPPN